MKSVGRPHAAKFALSPSYPPRYGKTAERRLAMLRILAWIMSWKLFLVFLQLFALVR
jgi:hypothetical protein